MAKNPHVQTLTYRPPQVYTGGMPSTSRPHTIYIHDDLWESAKTVASSMNVSTARIINSAIHTYITTNAATGDQSTLRFEVDASGPTHRKPPVELHTSATIEVDDDDVPL